MKPKFGFGKSVALVGALGCILGAMVTMGMSSQKDLKDAVKAGVEDFKFDFDDFKIATAEYADGPTGLTLLYFPKSFSAAIDVRGGAAATRESTILDPISTYPVVDAVVLAGGSTYGLEAASGVMQKILESRGNRTDFDNIPSVASAVVYDFSGRTNALYPDKALGAQAFDQLVTNTVRIGRAGGGAYTSVGKYFGRKFAERSGQGAAFKQAGKLKVFVLTVVNACGNILDLNGNIVAGNLDPATGTRKPVAEQLMTELAQIQPGAAPVKKDRSGNTTISILVTNLKLDRSALQRVAMMSHTAMGRVIEPFQSPDDGDTLFAVSTGTLELPADQVGASEVGTLGGRALQEAVNEAIRVAR